jgi:hypothetical protein
MAGYAAGTDGTISIASAFDNRRSSRDQAPSDLRSDPSACSRRAAANGQLAIFMKLSTHVARLFWY